LYMGRSSQFFARYILLIIPMLVILGATVLDRIGSWIALVREWQNRRVRAIVMGAALALSLQPLLSSVWYDYLLTQTDTRTLAMQWIEANFPDGTKIAIDWLEHGPPLATPKRVTPHSSRTYDVTHIGGTGLSDHSIEWYRERGFDYLIATSFIYDIPLVDEKRNAERQAFYASLNQELELVHEFCPYEGDTEPPFIFEEIYGPAISLWQRERPGPTLKVYRVER